MKEESRDALYPIRVVAKRTGLSQAAIRVWERRYGAVVPARSDGNTRNYSSQDIRRLGLLKAATDKGHSIKNVARLSEEQLKELIDQSSSPGPPGATEDSLSGKDRTYQSIREDYMGAIHRFDVRRAQRILSRAAALLSPSDLIFQLLIPLLRNTGHLWAENRISVSHEHLISMQVRALLVKVLDFHAPQPGAPRIIVATPEGHFHEFGALIGAFIAESRGFDPIYLGPSMPEQDLNIAIEASRADLLLLSILKETTGDELAVLNEALSRMSKKIDTWIGLPGDHPANAGVSTVTYFNSFEELDNALTRRNS